MKKQKKRIKVRGHLDTITINPFDNYSNPPYKYSVYMNEPNHSEYFYAEIEMIVPETIKEFCQVHNITKSELVEWLNDNYKK